MRGVARTLVAALCGVACAAAANAQLLSEEELRALVDDRVGALGPYRSLLNDPDPARSMAAMEIMLGSGDATLIRVATEFGLLAADPKLQRIAAEAILASGVPLTVTLDGTGAEDIAALTKAVRTYNEGAVTPEGIVYISVPIGDFDAELGCYVRPAAPNACNASINGDGIYITAPYIQGRLGYGSDGVLTGAVSITGHAPSMAAEMKILE